MVIPVNRLSWGVVLLLVCVIAAAGGAASAAGPDTQTIDHDAERLPSRQLSAVKAFAADDAWAVGVVSSTHQPPAQALVKHWDGLGWQRVAVPNPGTKENLLYGVDGSSPSDVWAVGGSTDSFAPNYDPLIEHWDGTSWTIAPFTGPEGLFLATSASSATDAWAVGNDYDSFDPQALAAHWDGTSWEVSELALPPETSSAELHGVVALSSHNVWAVGTYSTIHESPLTLIEHWDGEAWSYTTDIFGVLNAVAGGEARDVWSVGDDFPYGLIEHWSGHGWSRIGGSIEFSRVTLDAVAVLAADDAWLVGSASERRDSTLVEHWDGTAWSVVPSPNATQRDNNLKGISAVSPTDIWAVGSYLSRGKSHTLTEHWDGTAWSIVTGHARP